MENGCKKPEFGDVLSRDRPHQRPNDDDIQSSSPKGPNDDDLQSSSPKGPNDDDLQSSSPKETDSVVPQSRPTQMCPVNQENTVVNIDGAQAPQFGDTNINTTGPVFNAPVELHQHYHIQTFETRIPQSFQQHETTHVLEKCEQLKSLLKKRAEIIASEESTLAEFSDRPLKPVSLSMVSKPQRIDDEFQAEGHYRNWEEPPEGDITGEEMFARAKQTAQQEVERKFRTDEVQAKQNFIEKHGNIVAVVGQAGIGKTTSAKQWALQALRGQLCGEVSYIFYILIRLVDFDQKMTLLQFLVSNMLPDFNCTPAETASILAIICRDPNVLLIFDGLNEAAFKSFSSCVAPPLSHSKNRAESYLKHLAGGNLLPRARKIFTSRPAQLYKLHPSYRPRFTVQILGLTSRSQDELGRQICGNRYDVIHQKLVQNRNVFAYCSVPVNFILTLNYLVNYDGDIQFVSLTRVLAFTCVQYSTTEHLHSQECELDKLAEIAWEGFQSNKSMFHIKHLMRVGIKASSFDAFLTTSVTKHGNLNLTILDGHQVRYFSPHIWQEFFAAFYLMLIMPIDEFMEQYQSLGKKGWEVVSKFVFGICDSSVFNLLETLVQTSSSGDWSLKKSVLFEFLTSNKNLSTEELKRVCSWARETNDREIASSVAALSSDQLSLHYSSLPVDLRDLFFVLAQRGQSESSEQQGCSQEPDEPGTAGSFEKRNIRPCASDSLNDGRRLSKEPDASVEDAKQVPQTPNEKRASTTYIKISKGPNDSRVSTIPKGSPGQQDSPGERDKPGTEAAPGIEDEIAPCIQEMQPHEDFGPTGALVKGDGVGPENAPDSEASIGPKLQKVSESIHSHFSSKLTEFAAHSFSTSTDNSDYIGCGGFGAIRRCYHESLGTVVAKCISLTGVADRIEKNKKSVQREAGALVRVRHPHIVQIYGFTTWNNEIAIILEYVGGGNLTGFLEKHREQNLSWTLRLRFARQLISALLYLHNKPGQTFCHCDVKPDNVLITNNLCVKLTDFGANNVIRTSGLKSSSIDTSTTGQCSYLYVSPEFYMEGTVNPASDIYSFGMVLYEIVTLLPIFHGSTRPAHVLMARIISGVRPDEEQHVTNVERSLAGEDKEVFNTLTDLMRKCWDGKASSRPKAEQICQELTKVGSNEEDDKETEPNDKETVPQPSPPTRLGNLSLFTGQFVVATLTGSVGPHS